MDRRRDELRQLGGDELPVLRADTKASTEQSLSRRGAKAHEDLRSDQLELGFEPGKARADLSRVGLLVQTALTARHPFEVLDDVADVSLLSLDARLLKRTVEQVPRRT